MDVEFLNQINDLVFKLDLNGEFLFVNQSFLDTFNIKKEQAKGKIWDVMGPHAAKNIILSHIQELWKLGGRKEFLKSIFIQSDKSEHVFKITSFISESQSNAIGVWFFFQDFTDVLKSKDETQEVTTLLNTIVDNLPVYLFVKDVDDDFRYLIWNKAFATYSKIPASKVIGHTDFEVFPDYNDALKFRNDDLSVVESGETIQIHESYEAADGSTRIVQTVKTIVRRKDRGPLLIGVSMDLTNFENIEQELVNERIKAEESDRLKSRFLANMSHEIRTPLNAIVGFANLLANADSSDDRELYSNIIEQNSDALLQLINDILDLSKIEAGTLEYLRAPMDLVQVFRNIFEMHRYSVQDGVQMFFDNDSETQPFIINEDCNRIAQVINNLARNAVKFTAHGEIHMGYKILDDCIQVYVSDTGSGIPADKADKIFERFIKLNQFAQGTGLGLPISRMIVNIMGGKIWVESQEGQGSTFYFTIPLR